VKATEQTGMKILAGEATKEAAETVAKVATKEGAEAVAKVGTNDLTKGTLKRLFMTPPANPDAWKFSGKRTALTLAGTGVAANYIAPEMTSQFIGAASGAAVSAVGNVASATLGGAVNSLSGGVGLSGLSSSFNSLAALDPTGGALALAAGIGLTKMIFNMMGLNMPFSGLANLTMMGALHSELTNYCLATSPCPTIRLLRQTRNSWIP
jgi:uncharacterized membrane protein